MTAADHVAALREFIEDADELPIPRDRALAALDALVGLLQQRDEENNALRRVLPRKHVPSQGSFERAEAAEARAERAEQEAGDANQACEAMWQKKRVLEEALRESRKQLLLGGHHAATLDIDRALAAAALPEPIRGVPYDATEALAAGARIVMEGQGGGGGSTLPAPPEPLCCPECGDELALGHDCLSLPDLHPNAAPPEVDPADGWPSPFGDDQRSGREA